MYRDVINPNLIAVKETAIQMQTKVVSMYELYGRVKEKIVTMNSQYARLFLDLLFNLLSQRKTFSNDSNSQVHKPFTI